MSLLSIFLWVLVPAMIYLLPSLVASYRRHANGMSIFVINLFLGWTLIGWVAALAMSFSANVRPAKA